MMLNCTDHQAHRNRHIRGRGFTLLEMLIAIGIIVALGAITVAAGLALQSRTQINETESILKVLDVAMQEWERAADRKITWGTGAGYEMWDDTPSVYTLTEVLNVIDRHPRVREILAQIDQDRYYTYDTTGNPPFWVQSAADAEPSGSGDSLSNFNSDNLHGAPLHDSTVILDSWGVPIRVVHPGRAGDTSAFDPATDAPAELNEDGTVYIDGDFAIAAELLHGIARSRRVLFVSAGPDGLFGDRSAAPNSGDYRKSLDNIYSYEPEQP